LRNSRRFKSAPLHGNGFTLVELLVVIAVIGVLVSLLLPAINSAREAARRVSCKNNIRQLSLAVLGYESAMGALPPVGWTNYVQDCNYVAGGVDLGCFPIDVTHQPQDWPLISWIVLVLPFMEEQALHDGFDFTRGIRDQSQDVVGASIGSLICPSSPQSANRFYNGAGSMSPVSGAGLRFAKGNYAAYCSPYHIDLELIFPGALGGFRPGDKVGQNLRKVRDGMSNTILAADVRAIEPEYDHRGVWSLPFPGSTVLALDWHHKPQPGEPFNGLKPFSRFVPDPSFTDVAVPNSQNEFVPDGLFVCRQFIMTQQYHAPCSHITRLMIAAPRSEHPGGVNAVALDGHAGFISNEIDSHVFAYLVSTTDRAPSPMSEYVR
jgi:prepilin-type N-terminal cleavage/methylation domain-containing protein